MDNKIRIKTLITKAESYTSMYNTKQLKTQFFDCHCIKETIRQIFNYIVSISLTL